MGKVSAHAIASDFKRVKKTLGRCPSLAEYLIAGQFSAAQIKEIFGTFHVLLRAAGAMKAEDYEEEPFREPKILTVDIETSYFEVRSFSIRDTYIKHDQIIPGKDRTILAITAKWRGQKELHYCDTRAKENIRDDKDLVKWIWELLNEADIIISKNGKRFDVPVIRARCQIHKLQPYKPFKHIDTEKLARRSGFPSHTLDYLSAALDLKYKKLKHLKFPGRELWDECLAGNVAAWNEMERYNKFDVLATEELFEKLLPWGELGVDLNSYRSGAVFRCQCGSADLVKMGFDYTRAGKFQQFKCKSCGAHPTARGADNNLMHPQKRNSLRGPR